MVLRVWTKPMRQLADRLHKYVQQKFENISEVDTSHCFNNISIISFRGKQTIQPHRDQHYDTDGNFLSDANSQKENSLTCILVVGDTRQLRTQLVQHKSNRGKLTKGHIPVGGDYSNQLYLMRHGALFILNPQCEKPAMRNFLCNSNPTFWIHGQCNPSLLDRSGMSIGIVFRVCTGARSINADTGTLVLTDKEKKDDHGFFQTCNTLLSTIESNSEHLQQHHTLIKNDYIAMKERNKVRRYPKRKTTVEI